MLTPSSSPLAPVAAAAAAPARREGSKGGGTNAQKFFFLLITSDKTRSFRAENKFHWGWGGKYLLDARKN